MKKQRAKIIIGLLAIIPFVIFSYLGSAAIETDQSFVAAELQGKNKEEAEMKERQSTVRASQNEQLSLSHEKIVTLTNRFMETLVQTSDEQYKVKQYDTKAELLDQFESFATREVAAEFVHFYYQEKADGLYILPTELPPWFVKDQSYQQEWLADNVCKITQHNQSDLYGEYVIEIEMTYQQGTWKITAIDHTNENNDTIGANQAI